jgi:hypothetical protein
MEITYVKRKDLSVEKYDACIEQSIQSRIYAFSWYLDIVADHWDVLVYGDYKAVMPIPWKRKFGFKYVVQPFWVIELGVFSVIKIDISNFIKEFTNYFCFGNLRLNTSNKLNNEIDFLHQKEIQKINLFRNKDEIFKNYKKDRKKDLRKAEKSNLKIYEGNSKELVYLFKNNVGKRTPYIKDKDYNILSLLIKECLNRSTGELLSVKDNDAKLVGSGFFLKHKKEVTILVSATDFKNRNNGANTYLIHNAILNNNDVNEVFNFGGSSISSVAKYFFSFGATTFNYNEINYNRLPFFIKIFKK